MDLTCVFHKCLLPHCPRRCGWCHASGRDGGGSHVRLASVMTRVVLFGVVLEFLAGCTTATIEPLDSSPRVRSVPGEGDYRWEQERGWVQPRYGTWGATDQIRADAMKAFQAGSHADALGGFLSLLERLPDGDPAHTEILFLAAECYYNLKIYESAVEYFTRVYRSSNASPENTQVSHLRIFDIAMDYLHGRAACSTIGIRHNCPGEGVDLLVGDEGLITEYRYLEFADDAVMEIANYYFDEKEYPEAVPLFERLLRDYCPSRSEWCELAEYQVALATFKQVRGIDYDQELLVSAEKKFRQYLQSYPRGAQAETARSFQRQISDMLAERYLRIAKYYLRESQPRAARIYLELVVFRYSSSGAAREAREIQGRLANVSAPASG